MTLYYLGYMHDDVKLTYREMQIFKAQQLRFVCFISLTSAWQ